MKESIRQALIFTLIVITGLLFIFLDLPLLEMIPLLIVIGIILLFLMGSIKPAEIVQRLKGLRERQPAKGAVKVPLRAKAGAPSVKEEGKFARALGVLVQSLKGITHLKTGETDQEKRIKEIDKRLDETLRPRQKSAPAGGAAAAPARAEGDLAGALEDPFLSLTGEDLEAGILDELEEEWEEAPKAVTQGIPRDRELPAPPAGAAGETGGAPALHEGELDVPGEPGRAEIIESPLSDLREIDLEAAEIEEDYEGAAPVVAGMAMAAQPSPPPVPPPPTAASGVKAPKKTEIDLGLDSAFLKEEKPPGQVDISKIARPIGGDEEILSLLATEAKIARRKDNESLLRDLKGFKAPSRKIEAELQDVLRVLDDIARKKK